MFYIFSLLQMPIVIGKSVNVLLTKFTPKTGQIYPRLRTPALGPLRMAMILGSVVRPLETLYLCRRQSKAFSIRCEVDMFFMGAKNI